MISEVWKIAQKINATMHMASVSMKTYRHPQTPVFSSVKAATMTGPTEKGEKMKQKREIPM